jgi:hypothetical protein
MSREILAISWARTHIDSDLVASLDKFILIVAAVQLRERREASRAHPVLKVFINV